MGDVDALCRRIVIIDKGKMLYDNDIEHLKGFFGSYRTLKIRVSGDLEKQAELIKAGLIDFYVWQRFNINVKYLTISRFCYIIYTVEIRIK